MAFLNAKRALLLGLIIVLMGAIPLSVYFLQKQQETRTRATAATTVSLCATGTSCTSNISVKKGDKFNIDIFMDPGTNQIMDTTLQIMFNKDKIATATADSGGCGTSICPTSAFPVAESLQYFQDSIFVRLSIGADPTKYIQTPTKVATITFLANGSIDQTQITFGDLTSATATTADPELNVISTKNPATIAIIDGLTSSVTPTPTGINITPTITTSPTPISTTSSAQNQPPICTALNADRVTSGTTPFSITFTANGNDPDGTINKVTFDFGDGPVQDITQAGGIGTSTISTQIAHTYHNSGTFKATAVLTDNNSAISSSATCTQTVTVSAGSGTGTDGTVTITPTPTTAEQITSSNTPTPTQEGSVETPGPGDQIIKVGIFGAILSIVGTLLFLAL